LEVFALIGLVVFVAACGIGVLSWFFAIFEFVAVSRFAHFPFRFGKLVYFESEAIPLPAESIDMQKVIKTENGKFKFVTQKECLFFQKLKLWGFRLYTPFPLKGKIRWRNGSAEIEGRIPLGTSLFLGAWVIGWTAGAAMLLNSGSAAFFISAPGVFIVGWVFAGGVYFLSIPYEIRRAKSMVTELKEYLTRGDVVPDVS
jgi:hypothetical protein